MNLEMQVCSLELAKRLNELGIKPDVQMYWVQIPTGSGKDAPYIWIVLPIDSMYEINSEEIPAFTAAELGEMLPNIIIIPNSEPFDNYRILINKFNSVDEKSIITNNYIINYECDTTDTAGENSWLKRKLTSNIYDPNLANALAKMLIYLIENNLIEVN